MKSSVSRLKLYKACRRAYYFKYIQELVPVEMTEALQTGKSYHALLEELYATGEVPEGYSKEHAMVRAYSNIIYPKFRMQNVEEWLEKEAGSHIMIGRIDGYSEDKCIVEHKSTSAEITEAYEYDLQWDEQILAYMYLTGSRKVYYTVCRKPTIRQKKDETEEEFFYRMLDWYEDNTDSKIRLLEVYRTDEEVEEFAKEFVRVCDSMQNAEAGLEPLYRNTLYCNKWGRRCEYASVCLHYNPLQEYVEFKKREAHYGSEKN